MENTIPAFLPYVPLLVFIAILAFQFLRYLSRVSPNDRKFHVGDLWYVAGIIAAILIFVSGIPEVLQDPWMVFAFMILGHLSRARKGMPVFLDSGVKTVFVFVGGFAAYALAITIWGGWLVNVKHPIDNRNAVDQFKKDWHTEKDGER